MAAEQRRVVDLFCGAGGMSLGFQNAGFQVVAAFDNWPDALLTFSRNKPQTATHLFDLSDKAGFSSLLETLSKVDLVIGGPPCQGFSIAGKRDPDDPRNKLFTSFVEAIKILQPSGFVMENVPSISSPRNKELFHEILDDFSTLGYEVQHRVLLASQFGVPQNRRRMFIVGVKPGIATFEWPESSANEATSVREAISDLPEKSMDDGAPYEVEAQSAYQKLMRVGSNGISNHKTSTHSARTIETIALVPDGGNYKDLPSTHQGIRNVNIAWTRLRSWAPSFTIDTGHRHHFHYSFNRVPTVREAARLQSFPDNFIFQGSVGSQLKQVGNAVPPMLASAVASGFNFIH